MPADLKKRLAQGTVSLIPLLEVSPREGGTYANDNLYCPHCGHYVPPRTSFTKNQKFDCRQCTETSIFIIWSASKQGNWNAELAPIN